MSSSSSSTEIQPSSSSSSTSSSTSGSTGSSSSSLQGCEPQYCASTFTTAAINGTYTWTGAYFNSKAVYNNGTYNLWYAASPYYKWAISVVVGGGIGTWLSSKTTEDGCPNGSYTVESGLVVVGACVLEG